MKIGIDTDDTITDTSLHFIKFVAEYFELVENYLKENNIFYIIGSRTCLQEWDWWSYMLSDECALAHKFDRIY